MGALLFAGLMFAALCLGGFFLVLGLVFLLLRYRGKKKGAPKPYHDVLTGVFFTLGAVICVLPVGYWLFLRSHSSVSKDYVNTGKMVEGGYQTGTFTVDGVPYERLEVGYSSLVPKGETVFSWDASSGWDRFFGYYNRGNYYAVQNALGLDMVRDDGIHRRLWCRADQLAQAQAWYDDSTHYQWYFHREHEDGESTYTLLSPQPDGAQMAALLAFEAEAHETVEFTVPAESEVQEYRLVRLSTDRVVDRDWIYLVVYDDQLCLAGLKNRSHTDTTRTDAAYPLPADMAAYFSSLLQVRVVPQNR